MNPHVVALPLVIVVLVAVLFIAILVGARVICRRLGRWIANGVIQRTEPLEWVGTVRYFGLLRAALWLLAFVSLAVLGNVFTHFADSGWLLSWLPFCAFVMLILLAFVADAVVGHLSDHVARLESGGITTRKKR